MIIKSVKKILILLIINIYKQMKYTNHIRRMTGLEPANDGTTTHCRNHLATIAFLLLR